VSWRGAKCVCVVDDVLDLTVVQPDTDGVSCFHRKTTSLGLKTMKLQTTQAHSRSMSARRVSHEQPVSEDGYDPNRRRFVKLNLLGLTLASTAGLVVSEKAWTRNVDKKGITPASPAKLDPDDRQAKALSYTAQSSKDGQSCANCALYTGTEGQEIGPCAIFSYRVSPEGGQLMVTAAGWCRAWAPRQPE
jgi:hypothetical protein